MLSQTHWLIVINQFPTVLPETHQSQTFSIGKMYVKKFYSLSISLPSNREYMSKYYCALFERIWAEMSSFRSKFHSDRF